VGKEPLHFSFTWKWQAKLAPIVRVLPILQVAKLSLLILLWSVYAAWRMFGEAGNKNSMARIWAEFNRRFYVMSPFRFDGYQTQLGKKCSMRRS